MALEVDYYYLTNTYGKCNEWELGPTCQRQTFFVSETYLELLPMVESRRQDCLVIDVHLIFSYDGNKSS